MRFRKDLHEQHIIAAAKLAPRTNTARTLILAALASVAPISIVRYQQGASMRACVLERIHIAEAQLAEVEGRA